LVKLDILNDENVVKMDEKNDGVKDKEEKGDLINSKRIDNDIKKTKEKVNKSNNKLETEKPDSKNEILNIIESTNTINNLNKLSYLDKINKFKDNFKKWLKFNFVQSLKDIK